MATNKRNYTTEKIDIKFKEIMKECAKERYFKGLEKKEPSLPEITRLAMKCPDWSKVVLDLKTKPRKEDIKNVWRI